MKSEILAHLHDVLQAGRAVRAFVKGRSFQDYCSDELLRSGVERKFEIMGEALGRIARDDPAVLSQIRDYRDIISFRNILVHGYDSIDDRIVWDTIETDLDNLLEDVDNLLK
jgi:uncharacterized protein with HEPN domain